MKPRRYFSCHLFFFKHEPPNHANMFSIVYIIPYLKNLFHCNFSTIWTLNPIYKVCVCPMMLTFVFFNRELPLSLNIKIILLDLRAE